MRLQFFVFCLFLTLTFSYGARTKVTKMKNPPSKPIEGEIEDLCARIHNNTAFVGVEPYDVQLIKNAYECQKACVEVFPACVAVAFYYIHEKKDEHICYMFNKNSLDDNVYLIPEKPVNNKDVIRSLELVRNCHQFDPYPPLNAEGVSSTDHASRDKRQTHYQDPVQSLGPWSTWGQCFPSGVQTRSQACEYGRSIQRRGCPARAYPPHAQPQPTWPSQPLAQPQAHAQYEQQRRYQEELQRRQQEEQRRRQEEEHRRQLEAQRAAQAAQAQAAPHYAQFQQPPVQDSRRTPAIPSANPCPNNICFPPTTRPPPPPAPACISNACFPTQPTIGTWAEWSDWSKCSCTCGDGIMQRRRSCPTGNCGPGEGVESKPCSMGPCETWSQWCEWSQCKATCGQGERVRTRYCLLGTQMCEGKDYEAERCDSGPCPEWSSWEEWSPCSQTCGQGGKQTRQRTCLGSQFGYEYCQGNKVEERPCDQPPCSFWSQWCEWTACSVSCGDGVKKRFRTCQYGTDCVGEDEDSLFCFGPPCSAWTEWEPWTRCSADCGPGQKTRKRSCVSADGLPSFDCYGDPTETVLCNERACAQWTEWCPWSPCDRECGGGIQLRSRVCEAPGSPFNDDAQCPGPDRETQPCNQQPCAPQCQWTEWCPWSQCSAYSACDVGVSQRSRQCVGEPGCHCDGQSEDSKQCRGYAPCTPLPPPPPQPTPC